MSIELVNEIFRSVGGPIVEHEGLFLYNLAKECKNGYIVEIGSAQGRSTICLAKGSKAGYQVKVYSIDPHAGGLYTPDSTMHDPTSDGTPDIKYYTGQGTAHQIFCDNLKKFDVQDIVIPIVDYSELAYKNFDNGKGWNLPIGLLWIDGDHRYKYVMIDVDLWAKHVVSEGKILFHDRPFPGVTRVLNKILKSSRYYNFKDVEQDPIVNITVR